METGGRGASLTGWLAITLAGLLALYALLYRPFVGGEAPTPSARLLALPLAFSLYGLAAWMVARRGLRVRGQRSEVIVIALGAVLLRAVILVGTVPANPDLGRHLWEGLVLAEGHNPYSAPPGDERWDPLRQRLAAEEDDLYSGYWLKHEDVRSVYGPLATALFAVPHYMSLDRPVSLRFMMTLFDLGTVIVLLYLTARLGYCRALVLIYAWSPVCLNGFADRGQIDAAMVFLVVAATALLASKRPVLAGVAFAGALLVKISPLLLALPMLRVGRWRFAVGCGAACTIAVLPFAGAGLEGLQGFLAFADRWRSSDSAFSALRWLLHLTPAGNPDNLARAIVAVAAVGYAVWWAFRVDPERIDSLLHGLMAVSVAVVILSPVTYPWYSATAIAFLVFLPRVWLLALTALPMLWYFRFVKAQSAPWDWMARAHGEGRQPWRLLAYGAVYAAGAIDEIRRRRRRRAQGRAGPD